MNNHDALIQQLRIEREPVAPETPRLLWPWLVIVGITAGTIVVLQLTSAHVPAPVQTIEAVAVAQTRASNSVLDANGYVTARREATVSAMITGRVAQVLIEEGQHVQQGQVLALLDDSAARAQLALSRAESEAARRSSAKCRRSLHTRSASGSASANSKSKALSPGRRWKPRKPSATA